MTSTLSRSEQRADFRFRKANDLDRAWLLQRVLSYTRERYPQIENLTPEMYADFEAFVNERVDRTPVRIGGLLIRFEKVQAGISAPAEIHAVADLRYFSDAVNRRRFLDYLDYLSSLRAVSTWETSVRSDNFPVIDALEACGFQQYGDAQTAFLSYYRMS